MIEGNRYMKIFVLFGVMLSRITCAGAYAQEDFQSILRQVQLNSQRTYDEINAASFEGHATSYVYVGYNPFGLKMVPFKEESYFEGFWMKPDSLRFVVKALRVVTPDSSDAQFGNLGPLPNPFEFIYNPSVLGMDDEADSAEQVRAIYPFALGADSLYTYDLTGEVQFGPNKVLSIKVAPIKPTTPGVFGTFYVDPFRKIVVGSDVRYNEAASFTQSSLRREGNSINLSIQTSENRRSHTKKALFYSNYWLPTTVEEEFSLKVWGIKLHIQRTIEFTAYTVNPEASDTAVAGADKIVYDRDPALEDSLFIETEYPNRLTKEEQELIIRKIEDTFSSFDLYSDLLESESIAREALKIGLERKVGRYFQLTRQIGNYLHYNRVEGLRLNYGFSLSGFLLKNSLLSLSGGYGFKDKRGKGEVGLLQYLDAKKRLFLEENAYYTLAYEESQRRITTTNNTFTSVLYKGDYRDYYYKKGGSIGIGYKINDNAAVKLSAVAQREESAATHTRFSIFKNKKRFRLNPEIVEGDFRGLRAALLYRSYDTDAELFIEHSNVKVLRSDFSYTLFKASARRSFRPGYHSRLHFSGFAGYTTGALTPQRWFDFGGKTFLNYQGNLRGVEYKAFTGDAAAYGTVEYVQQGGALYDRGVKLGILRALQATLWAGAGWSELSGRSADLASQLNTPRATTKGLYNEFGLAVGDILNIFRLDIIRNSISGNTLQVTFNVLR